MALAGLLMLTLSVTAYAADNTYIGADGKTYTEADFLFTTTSINPSTLDGNVGFCWKAPEKYFEGFAVYAVEGKFTKSLTEYEPSYLDKNTNANNNKCYTFPKQFTYDSSVSVHVYPYIQLQNGEKKFLQPGYETSAKVSAYMPEKKLPALKITGVPFEDGVKIDWDALSGLGTDFDKYNISWKKGVHQTLDKKNAANGYLNWDYYNLLGLEDNANYTFQVVPVKLINGQYFEVGEKSNLVVVKVNAASAATLDAPVITKPENHETLTNYPRHAYLEWHSVKHATQYEIELACDECSSTETMWLNPNTYKTKDNFFTTPALAGDNWFRFRVKALDDKGNSSQWSNYSYFKYKTTPIVEIPAPAPVPAPAPAPAPAPVPAEENEISLSIAEWKNGMPLLSWTPYTAKAFDGYAVYARKGTWDKDKITAGTPLAYISKAHTTYQLSKLQSSTDYTVFVAPYAGSFAGNIEFLQLGSNIVYFKTGNTEINKMSCGNSSGDDGNYSACKGDTIEHKLSGVTLKVVRYGKDKVLLKLNGTQQLRITLIKNKPRKIISNTFMVLTLTYTETSDKFGVFIEISSYKMQLL